MKSLQILNTLILGAILAVQLVGGFLLHLEVNRLRFSGETRSPAPIIAAAVPAASAKPVLPAGQAKECLQVIRGVKVGVVYPLYEGHNFIGRADEKPVDIDLDDQETPDRVWSSRQHALLSIEAGNLVIEDLNSANGTFVNRNRVYPGKKMTLKPNDVIQIGTVQLKLIQRSSEPNTPPAGDK